MRFAVPEDAAVANAVGAAASRVTVEQTIVVSPLRGPDGVVRAYQVRGLSDAPVCETLEGALEVGRSLIREEALAEARRRGAKGDLTCTVSESRNVYEASGVMEIVRDWTLIKRP